MDLYTSINEMKLRCDKGSSMKRYFSTFTARHWGRPIAHVRDYKCKTISRCWRLLPDRTLSFED